MPPVLAVLGISATTAITVGITVIGTGIAINNSKKAARKMEAEFKRQQELQDEIDRKLASQESIFYGGGGGASLREDTKLMLKSSKSPRNVVFGRDRVSGPMMPFFSYEQNNVLYHRFGVVLAGHECDAVETIYFDDEPVTLDTAGWVVAPAKYTDNGRGLFFIEKKLGAAGQTASAFLVEAAALAGTPTAWGADRLASGVCYVVVHMEANYDVLHDVGLPNISAIVRGVKAYDPRTMTTAWTRNPALLARWWLVDSIYSPLTTDAEIDQAELIASANVCDELVQFSATVTAQRYACDGALNTTANPLENLNKIMSAMDGDAVWVSGKWQLIAGYYKPPTLAINESHVAGGQVTISPYAPTAQIINAISGQFKGPETKYQAAGYPMIAPPDYLAEDGGEVYERKDDFDLVNDALRCQMIAWQRLSRARQQLGVNLVCNLKAYNSSPLQTVTLSLAEFGYSEKEFQVRKRIFNGFAVEYFLQETGAGVWAWNYSLVNQTVQIPNINVNIDLTVDPLQNVVIDSGTENLVIDTDGTVRSRMRVRWDAATSYFVLNGGKIEWQYRTSDTGSGAGPWLNAPPCAGNATTVYIEPVQDGVSYDLRGRAISQIGRRSNPTELLTHVVVGKTEPPSDVANLKINGSTLTWDEVLDLDLAGYVLRFNYGSNAAWSTATPINNGVLTQSPYDWTQRPAGTVTVLIKAIDTTGHESLGAAVVYTNLGDAPIANVVEEIDFHPLFNGEKINCTVVSGNLLANSTTAFYPAGNQPMYPSGLLPFYPVSQYLSMAYTTEWVYISSVLAGSNMTLDLDFAGVALRLEYRTQSQEPAFGGDSYEAAFLSADEPAYDQEGDWLPWPGQLTAANGVYQFRVTIGSGEVQGRINTMALIIDAPDMEETINDLALDITGTALPYTKPFTVIKGIQATLQSGSSGAVNILTDKTNPLAPVATAVNSTLTAVAGASGDFTLKGY